MGIILYDEDYKENNFEIFKKQDHPMYGYICIVKDI